MKLTVYARCLTGVCLTGLLSISTLAQTVDLANLKAVRLSGGLSVNTLYNSYNPTGADPLSYFVSGNVTLQALGTSIPVTLSYSSRKFTYSQPFSYNQIGIHPTYKWATAHLGSSTMTFSPYTLNGHQFNGVGFELAPGKWKINTMYGRLIKAQGATELTPASFQRIGSGVSASWQGDKLRAGLISFYAQDDPNSVTLPARPDTAAPFPQPTPQRNLVLGLTAGATLFGWLQFDVEYANSVLERNRTVTERGTGYAPATLLWRPNATAQSYHAVKSTLNALLKRTNTVVGLGYERVDPDYVTLGGYFFNNDFTNVTLNLAQPFWGGKLNASGNIGLQWDDLKNSKSSAQRRLVGSANIIATPTPRLNLSFVYSSFYAYTFIRSAIQDISRLSPLEQIDTLNLAQITQNLATNVVYQLRNTETNVQSLALTGTLMGVVNRQGDLVRRGQLSQVLNGGITYSFGLPKQALTLSTGVNVMDSYVSRNYSRSVGPTFSLNKSFLRNTLTSALMTSYLHATAEQSVSQLTNARLTVSYAPHERHNFNLLVGSLWQTSSAAGARSNQYTTATLGYTTRF